MKYWLVKSEPDVYSYNTLETKGKGVWDGVRNYQARNNLREMKVGDLLLFYHSNIGKEVVGIAKVTKESFPDPTTDNANWLAIEVAPVQKLKKAVTLENIKKDPLLQNMPLVKNSRLSVMPVSKLDFERIVELGS
ncbi:MAG: EVE domain-containing protein [Bacteroidota bacterium]|nr:EVE domain-containing protein [Bacteroidota bacterium]